MRKNNCTLLIDGNWLLISRFSVINGGFEKHLNEFVKEHSQTELQELMAKSINVVLNRFPIIDNIVLVTDGGSWRKQLPIPKSLENVTYKGNRSQSKELDWKYIYGALNKLSDQCKELGITVSNHSSIEGDDWLWYWSRRLNSEGTSCIIWSSDNDLKQLVQTNDNTAFTAWYNERNGMWFDESQNDEITDEIEFFMKPIRVKSPILEDLKVAARTNSYVKPDNIIMEKIVCGDAGDNIKSIAKVVKGNRTYTVSVKMWYDIRNSLNITNLNEFLEHKDNIISEIVSNKKFQDCDTKEILEMIDYNVKLVWLHENIIPETIVMYMNQCEYNVIDVPYIKSNYKVLCKKNDEIEKIFDSLL
jgi:5'-3' exonuclease